MIRKLILTIAMALCVMMTMGTATAGEGYYLGVQSGMTWVEDTNTSGTSGEMDSGYAVGITGGYDFGMFRVEAEGSYRENDIDKIVIFGNPTTCGGDISSTSLMFNGYVEFENKTQITPYVGAGLGINRIEHKGYAKYGGGTTVNFDTSETVFAWSVTAGLAWNLSDTLALDLSYRYLTSQDVDTAGTSNWGFTSRGQIDYEVQNILIGLRWYF
ncbi:outer membrane protein [Desulfospira joergensenii]|uniref:outer membrane protein n=1 Tax=Desulfospira joergensenii TaxID=53329 RepID=UPI0003B50E39|nr:outer membrane beta-barrel protein [Desulfospira joergensenii]